MATQMLLPLGVEEVLTLEDGRPKGSVAKYRAKRKSGVGDFICNALRETADDFDKIAKDARQLFGGATSKACVSWYMSKLKSGKYGGIAEDHARLK